MKFFKLIFVLTISNSLFGQVERDDIYTEYPNKPISEYSRVLTFYELWEEILFSRDTLLVYENIFVVMGVNSNLDEELDSLIKTRDSWTVIPEIRINSSIFGHDLNHRGFTTFLLNGIDFSSKLSLTECAGVVKYNFENCVFEKGLEVRCPCDNVSFESCFIEGEVNFGQDIRVSQNFDGYPNSLSIFSTKINVTPLTNSFWVDGWRLNSSVDDGVSTPKNRNV